MHIYVSVSIYIYLPFLSADACTRQGRPLSVALALSQVSLSPILLFLSLKTLLPSLFRALSSIALSPLFQYFQQSAISRSALVEISLSLSLSLSSLSFSLYLAFSLSRSPFLLLKSLSLFFSSRYFIHAARNVKQCSCQNAV